MWAVGALVALDKRLVRLSQGAISHPVASARQNAHGIRSDCWAYCRRPTWLTLALWIGALAALYVINRNLWALATLPLIFAAGQVKINVPRGRLGFYVYYPAHLSVLWIVAHLL